MSVTNYSNLKIKRVRKEGTRSVKKRVLPAFIKQFHTYLIKVRQNAPSTADNHVSRLLTIHNWLLNNKPFQENYTDTWQSVKNQTISYATIQHMTAFFTECYETTSANTRLAYKSAIMLFHVFAEVELSTEPPIQDRHWRYLIVGKKNKQDREKTVLIITDDLIQKILTAVWEHYNGSDKIRNNVILRTLIETGGRRSEIRLLLYKDFRTTQDPERNFIVRLRNQKTIQRRYKERLVPISEDLYNAVQQLHIMNVKEAQHDERFIFLNDNYQVISRGVIDRLISQLNKELSTKITPHLFRHYRISSWCRSAVTEADIAHIAYMAGDSINTIRNTYLHDQNQNGD